ncbi:hypothetical protein FLO80_15410 [Aquicoccus porphyridii]|uniref:Uncharacterized protein n=1 Tax=Aquicoccus porphyridii TaxID=1852029 RepID=A0A5A9Z5R0_9RHOB|nr:hypothetical protein [Aquicoccus porphyridii]KAA0912452.1 hypothetical protein FLO80_15410 [Aquicoccus porphyridii]RAI53132.1 hypothetical protein DOO74_14715 [Rhodobacteraceae bacterium AsT-22]
MPVLIKTEPLSRPHDVGTLYPFKEKAYRDPVFGKGELAFVWIDGDGKGGEDSRLYAEGMVAEEPVFEDPDRQDSNVRVKIVLTAIEPGNPLKYREDIRSHRDDPSDRVMHNLADVICKNALKKVTLIGRPEADLLRSRFEE